KHFQNFILLCWPQVYDQIDWSNGYQFLEQEFVSILKKEEIGTRITDKLVQVRLKNGKIAWALLHIEVDRDGKRTLPERIFIYRYRIYDVYTIDIGTMVILLDGRPDWRHNVYEREFWGTKLKLEYPMLKIIDFKDGKEELKNRANPLPYLILAQ